MRRVLKVGATGLAWSALVAGLLTSGCGSGGPGSTAGPDPAQHTNAVIASGNPFGVVTSHAHVATGLGSGGYTPQQIRTAYLLNGMTQTGLGQTIVIIDAQSTLSDAQITTDLHTFDSTFGLPDPPHFITASVTAGTLDQGGNGTVQDSGWVLETSLDVQWAHALAPGANILLIKADSANNNDVQSAIEAASQASNYGSGAGQINLPAPCTVSMSFTTPESGFPANFSPPETEAQADALNFSNASITYVAASGDSGPSLIGWPAACPLVTGIGGTVVDLTAAGNRAATGAEVGWSGSSGGTTAFETEPAYQANYRAAAGESVSATRIIPDVAFDGGSTVQVYIDGGVNDIFGTSIGAPCWSGIVACMDQQRTTSSLPPLGNTLASGLNERLYALAQASLPNNTPDLTDIVTGSDATRHYDPVTGLGVPQVRLLISALDH